MQRMTDALSRMLNDPSTMRAMRTLQTSRERAATAEERPSEMPERPEVEGAEAEEEEQGDEDGGQAQSLREEVSVPDSSEGRVDQEEASGNDEVTLNQSEENDEETSSTNDGRGGDSPDDVDAVPLLPGPSGVVTHPGNSSRDPITGQRQRRRGVSAPPTGIM